MRLTRSIAGLNPKPVFDKPGKPVRCQPTPRIFTAPARLTIHKRLTRAAKARIHWPVSRPDGRSRKCRKAAGEESPGSIDRRCRITSGGVLPAQAGRTSGKVPQRTNRRFFGNGKGEKVR